MLKTFIVAIGVLAASIGRAEAYNARKLIACSPFVYPCHCGLCPHIVDCSTTASAECFCGTAAPGVYPHPQDKNKFWMCSYDAAAQVKYGVEVPCPARLLYDPTVKVCTFPQALSKSEAAPTTGSAAVNAAGAARQSMVNPAVQSKVAQGKPTSNKNVVAIERAVVAFKP